MRQEWGGRHAARMTRAVLIRDHDASVGYAPCYWCGRRATEADHWPIGRDEGGADALDNLVAACRPCNASRGAVYGIAKRKNTPPPSRRW